MRTLAAAPVLLALLLSSCGDGGKTADVSQADPTASSSAVASEAPNVAPTEGKGTPKTDPCELLTAAMAEGALGVPVGPPTTIPGSGNVTCQYTPADGTKNVFALLTTYAASGKAALATATAEFPDAKPVPNLGDAALVSRKGHAIGVSVGDLLFGMSLLRSDAFTVDPAVGEAQLITLARTVVQAR